MEQIESRFAELSEQMSDHRGDRDRERYAQVGREWRGLQHAHELAEESRRAASDAAGAREMLADGDDRRDPPRCWPRRCRLAELDEEIRLAMVEPDPSNDKNVIVEIRMARQQEEARLFAGDLYRMLTRYAERHGFATRSCRWPTATTRSPSRATAPTACSSTRAAPTACSACPRPSRRAASTPPPPPWPCCPRPRTWRCRSTTTTSRSTSTAPPAPAGSR